MKLLYASHTRSGKELQRRLTSPPNPTPGPATNTLHINQEVEKSRKGSANPDRRAIHLYSNQQPTVLQTGPSDSMLAGSTQFFVGQNSKMNDALGPGTTQPLFEKLNDSGEQSTWNRTTTLNDSPSASIGQSYLILDENAKELGRQVWIYCD